MTGLRQDHLGGQVGGAFHLTGGLADPDQLVPYDGGGAAGTQLVGDHVRALREVVQQQAVRRRDALAPVARHGHPAYEHAGVAQREVQRLDQVRHRPHPATVSSAERRGPYDGQPLVGGRTQLDDELVGRACVVQHVQRALEVPVADALRGRPQQRGDLPHDDRRLLARASERRPGHDSGGDQRHGTADQGVGPPDERSVGGRHQRAHDDGLHRCLVDEDDSLPEQHGCGHGEADDQRDLPAAGPEQVGQHVADEDADGDPDGHLRDPAQPLAIAGAEADHRGDRSEERRRVVEDVGGDHPGDPRGNGALRDLPGLRTKARPAPPERGPTAGDRVVEVWACGSPVARQVLPGTTSRAWIHGRAAS